MSMKNKIKQSMICAALVSSIGVAHSEVKKEDINSNLKKVVKKLPQDLKSVFIKNLKNKVFQKMLSELGQVHLSPEQQAHIQDYINKNSAELIKDTFIFNVTGFGGPAAKIWSEIEKISPDAKKISASSKKQIKSKVFPAIQKRMVKSIFKSKGFVANLGVASRTGDSAAGSGRSVDIGLSGNYCFKDYLIKSKRVSDACVELKVGSITGVKLKAGKMDLTDEYKKYLGKFKLAATLDGLSVNYDANSSTFDFQLMNPGLVLSRGPFSLKVAAVTGFSHDGAYIGADLSAAVQQTVDNIDYLARIGAQTATDGHQLYGQIEVKGKVAKDKKLGMYLRLANGNRRGPGGNISGNTATGGLVFGF